MALSSEGDPPAREAGIDTVRIGMTVVFDHDVVDGALVAMFLQRPLELMESASGL